MSRLPKTKQSPAPPLHRRIVRRVQGSFLGDRQLIVRSGGRITYVPLPRTAQAGALLVVAALGLWTAHTTYAYFSHDRALIVRDAEIAARESLLASLRRDLEQARRQAADATDALQQNQKGVVGLIGENQTLTNTLRSLRDETSRLDGDRGRIEKEKAELTRKLAAAEKLLAKSEERNRTLAGDLKATGAKLAHALNDKSQAAERGMSLSGRVSELQERLASLKDSQSGLLDRIAETSQSEIRRLRGILASTGLRVDRLLEAQGVTSTGTGGPFEAAPRDSVVASVEDGVEAALGNASGMIDQLEGLQRIVRSLPLAAPLDYYHISSPYGVRTDPINGESAIHRGLDFGSKFRATVLATAKGTVIFAGWKGKFGRFVEIDHGNGVVTRYGHLRRIMVSRGDKIEFRTPIGQMGNSGRSTGTHLHYEIQVNGASVDPQKFLKAGKNVFKG